MNLEQSEQTRRDPERQKITKRKREHMLRIRNERERERRRFFSGLKKYEKIAQVG